MNQLKAFILWHYVEVKRQLSFSNLLTLFWATENSLCKKKKKVKAESKTKLASSISDLVTPCN